MHLYITPEVAALIDLALVEDSVGYDVTSQAFFAYEDRSRARLVAKEPLVMCGAPVASAVFARVDEAVEVAWSVPEGEGVEAGAVICELEGPVISLLVGERTALNFLQRMCGVATTTAAHVAALGESSTKIADTRKTLPGWRLLDKYAVRCGGGVNHRLSLGGGVMLKENHIAAAGGIEEAVAAARRKMPHTLRVEVEVEELGQLEEALRSGAEIIMLDNMDRDDMAKAVAKIRGDQRGEGVVIEASGNMTLERLPELSDLGLDVISIGGLTHSVKAADISMRMEGT